MRVWAGIIEIADHFLGCDSLGQHIVKALGKTATIVTGSTYPVNISYPDDDNFDIIDVGEGKRCICSYRLTMEEEQDRLNDEVMELSKEHIDTICASVRKVLEKAVLVKNKKTNAQNLFRNTTIKRSEKNNMAQWIAAITRGHNGGVVRS